MFSGGIFFFSKRRNKKSLFSYHFRWKERKLQIFIAAKLLTVKPVLKQQIRFPQDHSGAVPFTEKSQAGPVWGVLDLEFTAVYPPVGQGKFCSSKSSGLGNELLPWMQCTGVVFTRKIEQNILWNLIFFFFFYIESQNHRICWVGHACSISF